MSWRDLFYIYNLVVNNESYGDLRLTPIFEDYIKEPNTVGNNYLHFSSKIDSGEIDLFDYTNDNKEVKTGEKRIYAPNVVAVVNGKAEDLESGISKKEKDPYMKLTEKMNKESTKKFECLMKCLEKSNVCTAKTSC